MSEEMYILSDFSKSLAQAVERAGKSTVLVNGRKRLPASGIVYTSDLILTADHVVERDEDLSVALEDGGLIPALIAGRDPGNDLALLRLEKSVATPAERASQEVKVGEMVIALGRPNLGGIEASLGMISAIRGPVRTGRGGMLERYLLTDSTPFPGFSGGPLIDTQGRVVGLNTSGLAHGASITIPIALAWASAEQLAKHGHIKHGYMGIRSQHVSLSQEMKAELAREQETGLLLVSVEENSPASAAGLMIGDILVAIEGEPVADHDELMVRLSGESIGKQRSIQVLRGGKPQSLTVIVGERS